MAYKSIMVFLGLEQVNEAALRVSCDLADRFDSRIIGVTSGVPYVPVHLNGMVAASMLEADYDELALATARCESRFRDAIKPCGQPFVWRESTEMPADFLAAEACGADVVIAELSENNPLMGGQRWLDFGDALMKAGRPFLIVPPRTTTMALNRVLVAWKDCAEARRAIAAALPMLQAAQDVAVVEIVDSEREIETASASVADVAGWLSRHGIVAQARAELAAGDTGKQLEAITVEFGADLIVAGAYGNSRFSEWVFGGVTSHLLKQRSFCALLMH
jgi:nucleotide-binding universal stress UspA family protein